MRQLKPPSLKKVLEGFPQRKVNKLSPIGLRFKMVLLAQQITIAEVAERAGVSRQAVYQFLWAKTPKPTTIAKYANVVGVSPVVLCEDMRFFKEVIADDSEHHQRSARRVLGPSQRPKTHWGHGRAGEGEERRADGEDHGRGAGESAEGPPNGGTEVGESIIPIPGAGEEAGGGGEAA